MLDLAIGHVDPGAHLTLHRVHRFTRTDQTGRLASDVEYADPTLAMRTGENLRRGLCCPGTAARCRPAHPTVGMVKSAGVVFEGLRVLFLGHRAGDPLGADEGRRVAGGLPVP